MTVELAQALWIVAIVAIACVIFSPIFMWILPDRAKTV
jgi:hypothetical protein